MDTITKPPVPSRADYMKARRTHDETQWVSVYHNDDAEVVLIGVFPSQWIAQAAAELAASDDNNPVVLDWNWLDTDHPEWGMRADLEEATYEVRPVGVWF